MYVNNIWYPRFHAFKMNAKEPSIFDGDPPQSLPLYFEELASTRTSGRNEIDQRQFLLRLREVNRDVSFDIFRKIRNHRTLLWNSYPYTMCLLGFLSQITTVSLNKMHTDEASMLAPHVQSTLEHKIRGTMLVMFQPRLFSYMRKLPSPPAPMDLRTSVHYDSGHG